MVEAAAGGGLPSPPSPCPPCTHVDRPPTWGMRFPAVGPACPLPAWDSLAAPAKRRVSLDGFTWVLIPPTIPPGLTRPSASILVLGLIKCLKCHFPFGGSGR